MPGDDGADTVLLYDVVDLANNYYLILHVCHIVLSPATIQPWQEEAETPKQIRGGIMHEGGAGHPSMSYFSHCGKSTEVREIGHAGISTLLFLSVLMLTTQCKNSISLSLPLILPT